MRIKQQLRSEFGKAHDLRVASYFIWSFYAPSASAIAGARALGLDLEALGFDTDRRNDLIKFPEALISRVAYAQEQARHGQKFFKALADASQEAREKLIG